MRKLIVAFMCCALAASAPAVRAGEDCVSGTVSAELTNDPGFEGSYKYCVELSWNVSQFSLSHLDVFPGFGGCDCVCDPDLIRFPTPAGTSTGPGDDDGTCTLDYFGEYVCTGDSSIPPSPNGPVIKFDPDPNAPCGPGLSGTGTFCFYSFLPPATSTTVSNGLAVKHDALVCFGPLTGTLPDCDAGCVLLPVQTRTFSQVKILYR